MGDVENLFDRLIASAPKELKGFVGSHKAIFPVSTRIYLEMKYKRTLLGVPIKIEFVDCKMYYQGCEVIRMKHITELFAVLTVPGNQFPEY